MSPQRRYRKKPNQFVIAICVNLDTPGIVYQKWGAEQRCKQGDWLVDNNGDLYSVDAAVFARTYRRVAPGHFVKTTPVWASRATAAGSVATKEGRTTYAVGDYLVSNNADGSDAYAIAAAKFEEMYERDD